MPTRLPAAVLALGLASLLPFVFCGVAVLAMPDARADAWMQALLGYGAVVLALFGGVHWGFALAAADVTPRDRLRVALGVVPALIGWAALLVTLVLPADVGLGVLITGFAITVLSEARLYRGGLVPSGYMWLRWAHSIAAVAILTGLLVLRLLGARIIL